MPQLTLPCVTNSSPAGLLSMDSVLSQIAAITSASATAMLVLGYLIGAASLAAAPKAVSAPVMQHAAKACEASSTRCNNMLS